MTTSTTAESSDFQKLDVADVIAQPKRNSFKLISKELRVAWEETGLSLYLYIRSARNRSNSVMLAFMAVLMTGMMFITMQIGNLLEMFVQVGRSYSFYESTAMTFATSYVRDISNQDTGYLGAAIFVGALLSAIVAPFTGTTSLTFISRKESAGLLNSRLKPYSDSIMSAALSVITPLQFISLTMVTSSILIAGGNPLIAFPATWIISLTILNINILFIWIEKTISIKKSGRHSRMIAAGIVLVLGIVILLDPLHGRNAFGLSDLFFRAIKGSASVSGANMAIFVIVMFTVNAVIALGALFLASSTINSPEFTNRSSKKRVSLVHLSDIPKTLPKATRKRVLYELMMMALSPFKYYAQYRLPFIVLVGLGSVVLVITRSGNEVLAGTTMIIPLIVALGWTANMLGILGGGLSWVLSFPKISERLVYMTFTAHLMITFTLTTALIIPASVLGMMTLGQISAVYATWLTASSIIGAFATSKSFKSPHPASLGSGAETILPPTTTLVYTLQIVAMTMLPGLLIFYSSSIPLIQWPAALTIFTIAFIMMYRLQRKWVDSPDMIKMTINKITQD